MFKVKIVKQEGIVPKRVTKYAAGLDCFSPFDVEMKSHTKLLLPLGFALELQTNTCGILKACSGLAVKYGLEVLAGVIDCYTILHQIIYLILQMKLLAHHLV